MAGMAGKNTAMVAATTVKLIIMSVVVQYGTGGLRKGTAFLAICVCAAFFENRRIATPLRPACDPCGWRGSSRETKEAILEQTVESCCQPLLNGVMAEMRSSTVSMPHDHGFRRALVLLAFADREVTSQERNCILARVVLTLQTFCAPARSGTSRIKPRGGNVTVYYKEGKGFGILHRHDAYRLVIETKI